MVRRREWFHRLEAAYVVLWWAPAGHVPTEVEAAARLEHLRSFGPSAHAFTFKHPFPAPHLVDQPTAQKPAADEEDRWACPVP